MMLCRKRKANFTKQELEVLVANVQARKEVLFTKRNTPVSNQAKQHAWECIARKVNSVETVGGEHRSVNDVRRKWVCLLSETKKAEMHRRRRIATESSSGPSSAGGPSSLSSLGSSGEYTPLLAENILSICKSIENGASVGRPSTRVGVEDANDLSMSSSNTGGAFGPEMNLIGHSLAINSNANNNNNNNDNNNNDNDASYLQVTSVYSQSEQIDGIEVHLNDASLEDVHSPSMGNKGSNIISNIKSLSRQSTNLRNNSSSLANTRVTSDPVNTASLYPVSNINNREVLQHIPNVNNDIGIVHITPNISSNYADNTVYVNDNGGSNMALPGSTVMSLRKRGHGHQGGTSDHIRNPADAIMTDDVEGHLGDEVDDDDDDAGTADLNPNATSIEHLDWNVGPPYTNSAYMNSPSSDQDRKVTPDHQPYHVTISGTESDVEHDVRPRRRNYYNSQEDYTQKLYWVEKKRLKIEERRLAIEEERLSIERERLELEKQWKFTPADPHHPSHPDRDKTETSTPIQTSGRPSENGRPFPGSLACAAPETTAVASNVVEDHWSVTASSLHPVPTQQTNSQTEISRMANLQLDLANQFDYFADEDSVGISY